MPFPEKMRGFSKREIASMNAELKGVMCHYDLVYSENYSELEKITMKEIKAKWKNATILQIRA